MALNLDNVYKLKEQYRKDGGTVPGQGGSGYARLITPNTGQGSASVGVAATKILGVNEGRFYAVIVNDSPNVVYLSFNPTAVLNSGIRLNANGGSIVLGLASDIPHLGEVWGIAAGVSVVSFVES